MAAQPKPGSKGYRDQLRARLMSLGFGERQLVDQVAFDLVRRCGRRPREAWRQACELSLDEVAGRYNTLTGDPRAPMRKSRVWDYEQWPRSGTRPTVKTLKILARIYDTSWEELVDLDDLAHMPEEDRDAYHGAVAARRRREGSISTQVRPATESSAVQPLATESEGEQADTPEAVIEEAAEESAQLAAWAGGTNVDDDALEYLTSSVRSIAHAYVYASPYALLLRTRRLRNRVRQLLQGHQRPPQTRELYLVGARACTLLAWMSGDLGNYRAASDHGWAAWMCAEHAGHDGARTWVRATQSKLTFWDGDYINSARLAADGLTYTPADGAAVLLALLEARAWARVGRIDEADAALGRWRVERERIPGSDEVGGVLGLTPSQQHYLAGSTHLWLHEPDHALGEAERSIRLFEETPEEQRFYGAEMLARIDAGRAHLELGDLDGAGHAIDPVLAVEPEQRLDTFTRSLGYLRGQLATPGYRGSRQAQQLQERIEHYAAHAVGSELDLRP